MLYALLGAVAIGLVLGLLGSGGSILTVPVLVYLAGEPDKVAIAESLAIVGAIAAVGAVPYARQRLVDWHSVLYFGVPGIVGTYGGAALARWVPGAVQLALFAVVMLVAAVLMFRGGAGRAEGDGAPAERQALWKIAVEGLAVGVLTGLVGVGGGFVIVPALVLLGGLPMRLAVGTSLLIIAAKSAAGFWKYTDVLAETGLSVDWRLIGLFAVIGIAGSFVGNALSRRVPQAQLKRGFAVFLVVMGLFILVREGPRALGGEAPPADAAQTIAPPDASADGVFVRAHHHPPSSDTDPTMSFLSRFMNRSDTTALSPSDFVARRTPDAAVLDVRTPAEYAEGHLAGATNVDVMASDFRARVEALDLPADAPVYLYCRSGNRSGKAAGILREMGYGDAYNVGGYDALKSAGAETEG